MVKITGKKKVISFCSRNVYKISTLHYVERKLLSFCKCIKSGSSYKTMQQIIWKLVLNTFAVTWGNSSSSLSYNHQVSASHSGINMCQCLGFKSTRQQADKFGLLFHIHRGLSFDSLNIQGHESAYTWEVL